MWSTNVRQLVRQASSAVVFIEVEDNEGKRSVGTAFHIWSRTLLRQNGLNILSEFLRLGEYLVNGHE